MTAESMTGPRGHYGAYWDHYAATWADQVKQSDEDLAWPGDEWATPERWDNLYQKIFLPAGVAEWNRAVEIGPGSGKYTLKVLSGSSATVRAYDISDAFLQVCEQRCQDAIERGRLTLRTLNINRPDQIWSELHGEGWARHVDAFYSIDAMVHVDLQYLICYLVAASAVLREGGKLIVTVADVTRVPGFNKLLEDIVVEFPRQGMPTSKFEWLSPDIVSAVLTKLGFTIEVLDDAERDICVVASLTDPTRGDSLKQYLFPRM